MAGWLILLGIGAVASGCAEDTPEVPQPMPSKPSEPSSEETGRAVLVYMLADNSLGNDGYDRANLADMIQAAREGKLAGNRLLVYHDDRHADTPALKEVTPLGLRILKYYDNDDRSVSPRRMAQVIADFKAMAPAGRYGLVFWSHATGWLQTGEPWPASSTAVPLWVGEDRGRYMNVSSLARILDGKGFDYIYFDCCHMASVEALYQLRHVADKFAGSAAELPARGMPYLQALPYLMKDDADLEGAALTTFSHYDALAGISRTATMSVVDASGLDALAQATRRLYSLRPTLPDGYAGQPFERRKVNGEPCYMFDFEDYVSALYANSGTGEMRRAYADWLMALDGCVTYQASTPYIFNEIKVDSHCGLTTYILRRPEDVEVKNYNSLEWYADVASALFTVDEQYAGEACSL